MRNTTFGLAFIVAGICLVLPYIWLKAALLIIFGAGLMLSAEPADKRAKIKSRDDDSLGGAFAED